MGSPVHTFPPGMLLIDLASLPINIVHYRWLHPGQLEGHLFHAFEVFAGPMHTDSDTLALAYPQGHMFIPAVSCSLMFALGQLEGHLLTHMHCILSCICILLAHSGIFRPISKR